MDKIAQELEWKQLLEKAISEPGLISEAYSLLHSYSMGNQMLAMMQCRLRGITIGPIATYPAWKSAGRQVRKGERAIMLCMPITCKKRDEENTDDPEAKDEFFTRFVYRNNWFVLSQTDGEAYQPEPIPDWDSQKALEALGITEEPFESTEGQAMGYAHKKAIAISPINPAPDKTRFHELAHIMLGHTAESMLSDSEITPRSLMEVEAESVALICLESLGLPGAEYCRGYIQNWNRGAQDIPEKSAQKIFKAADQILKAGR